MTAGDYGDLPSDMVLKILSHTNWRVLIKLRLVCLFVNIATLGNPIQVPTQINSTFRNLIDQDVNLQYQIELGGSGMVDNPSFTREAMSTADKLALLRNIQRNWETHAWEHRTTFPCSQKNLSLKPINNGIFCEVDFDSGMPQNVVSGQIRFSSLPTSIADGSAWTIEGTQVSNLRNACCVCDLEQDLLVSVKYVTLYQRLNSLTITQDVTPG